MKQGPKSWRWLMASIAVWAGISSLACSATAPIRADRTEAVEAPGPQAQADAPAAAPNTDTVGRVPLVEAFETATRAADLAQSASTADDWSAVATAWSEAIVALQAVPLDSPEWLFAQRKTREYLANQAIALQQAEVAARLAIFPTLGNEVLDEQLALYLSYIATFDTPDVLVVGSSRALQGLNPQILQQRLSQQGHDLQVYNFAVNGATAQVVSFMLRQLLTPEQLPEMIIWAGGSRSFNSGRFDLTFAKILDSPGYAAVQAGDRPEFDATRPLAATVDIATDDSANETTPTNAPKTEVTPINDINGYGFWAVNEVFNPADYYTRFPRVAGLYDGTYSRFNLNGVQTVSFRAIVAFAQTNDIPFVFVNLPLSTDYLDDTRLRYERQFQQFLTQEANRGEFTIVDLLQGWPGQNNLFADPSHLNRVGAAQVAIRVAEDAAIPWELVSDATAPDTEENEAADEATSEEE
ncbi:MAG: hypothetical protein AAF892_08530 [Cyanobacteria bacterium P01_D01_bin.71]